MNGSIVARPPMTGRCGLVASPHPGGAASAHEHACPFMRDHRRIVVDDTLRRPQVQRFAQFYVQNAGRLAQQVGYVGLGDAATEMLLTRVRERHAGTAFGGRQEIGVDIEEVLSRPLDDGTGAAPAP